MKFTKMQGIGNDYVYIYGLENKITNLSKLAREISDRHYGVGSDGLILIDPSDKFDFTMRMFNADGSESAMCGNGSRCVGKYVYDKGYTRKTEIDLETKAGIKHLTLYPEHGNVKTVKVDMGEPILNPRDIPINYKEKDFINQPLEINGQTIYFTCVSMGNPHAVTFTDNVDKIDIEKIGPLIENHPFFPQRTNVEFIEIINNKELKMRVWERGSGETLACGTGACASLVAGVLNNLCEREIVIHLLGGDLNIEWNKNNHIYMTGGAKTVFEGDYILDNYE